jgi:AcrR family transcriptional regulator
MTRKEQILKTGYEIVGRSGIEGLHARTIAAELGINHAAVHYYFRTRYDLLAALAEYAFHRFELDRQRLLNKSKKGQKLEALFAQAAAYTRPESSFAKNWASFFVASIAEPTLRPLLVKHLHGWVKGLEEELAHLENSDTPLARPSILAAALIGIIVMAHACGEEFPAGEALCSIASCLQAA